MMPSAWVFGEVEIRPAERRVLRAGVPQALGGRAFDLLLALVSARPQPGVHERPHVAMTVGST